MNAPRSSTRALPLAALMSLALVVPGCGDSGSSTTAASSSDSDSDGGSDGESTTSDATTSATTGGSAPTGTASQTGTTTAGTTGADTTSAGTTGATSTGEQTTGEPLDSCVAACENLAGCVPDYSLEECISDCKPELDTPECLEALDALNECLAEVSCDDLMESACIEQSVAYEELCFEGTETGGQDCAVGGEGDMNGCKFSLECPDETLSMQCAGDKCTCLANGEPDGECQIPNVCGGDKNPVDLLEECCGYVP